MSFWSKMIRKERVLIGLFFLVCFAAAGQMVQSQQNATTTVTSLVTSNETSTIAVGTQTVTTTSGQATPVFSNTVTIPGTHGVCGIFFVQAFNGTAGELLAGSVGASSAVDVYVMTSTIYQSWSHQIVAGGNCAPSSVVAIQKNTTSYNFAAALPTTGSYDLVVNNLSQTTVTAQVNVALTASPPSLITAVEYSTITQPMVQTVMQTSIQTTQSPSQNTGGAPGMTTFAAGAVVIVIVIAVVAYLAKSKRGKPAK